MAEYKDLTPDELTRALVAHQLWANSGHERGCRANLSGTDLSRAVLNNANLDLADLSHSNLSSARLFGATLRGAKLTGSILQDADLRCANLQDCDLIETLGLTTPQLAGTVLTGAKLPDPITQFDSLASSKEMSEVSQHLFAGLLLACAYCILTIVTTRDSRLFTNADSVQLPILSAAIPVPLFFLVAPFALFFYFFYFHIGLQRLWEELARLPAVFPDGTSLFQKASRWMLNGIARVRLNPASKETTPLWRLQYVISLALAYWFLPFTIAFIWIKFLPRQEYTITVAHCAVLALAISSSLYVYRLALATLTLSRPLQAGTPIPLIACTLFVVALGVSVASVSLRLRVSPTHVDFRESDLSTRPSDWDAQQAKLDASLAAPPSREDIGVTLAPVRGAVLSKLNLAYMKAFGSFLVNSDMAGADLSHADLYKADLRGVNLEGGNLREAWMFRSRLELSNLQRTDLEGADLRSANLRRAKLFQADLQLADLTGAHLEYTALAANAGYACFSQGFLKGSTLAFGTFTGAGFLGTDLTGADLSYAVANGGKFINAALNHARLSQTNLVGADLRWAQMEGVSLDRTYLQGADLRQVTGLDPQELKKAFIDEDTKCPENPEITAVCKAMSKIKAPDLGAASPESDTTMKQKATLAAEKRVEVSKPMNACDRPVRVSTTPDSY